MELSPEKRKDAKALFEEAINLVPDERLAFLQARCRDEYLLREVQRNCANGLHGTRSMHSLFLDFSA